jgi:hypothetical protein
LFDEEIRFGVDDKKRPTGGDNGDDERVEDHIFSIMLGSSLIDPSGFTVRFAPSPTGQHSISSAGYG